MTTDEAFLSAETPKAIPVPATGGTLPLHPFSMLRQIVARDLGLGTPEQNELESAVLVTWLCTLEPGAALRARQDKAQALIDAAAWADAQGWSLANSDPLMAHYTRISQELFASTQAVVDGADGGPAPPKGGGPPGPSNPPPKSPN